MSFGGLFDGIGNLVIEALNAIIKALATAANAVLGLLPGMPTFPNLPSQFSQVMGWINWFFPVGTVFDIVAFMVTAWLLWMGLRVILRWAKLIAE